MSPFDNCEFPVSGVKYFQFDVERMSYFSISVPCPRRVSEHLMSLQINGLGYPPTFFPEVARTFP
jgi:hypothetical protein